MVTTGELCGGHAAPPVGWRLPVARQVTPAFQAGTVVTCSAAARARSPDTHRRARRGAP